MSGSVPLLSLYAFMAWTGKTVHLSVILMYINSQSTAVYSGISYQ